MTEADSAYQQGYDRGIAFEHERLLKDALVVNEEGALRIHVQTIDGIWSWGMMVHGPGSVVFVKKLDK